MKVQSAIELEKGGVEHMSISDQMNSQENKSFKIQQEIQVQADVRQSLPAKIFSANNSACQTSEK